MTSRATYAQGRNKRAKVIGVTSLFQDGFKGLSTGGSTGLVLSVLTRTHVGDFTGLRDELTAIVLLNGYSVKLPAKFIPLYP